MQQAPDSSNAVVRPPIALAVAFAAGLVLDWLYPLPFVPAQAPRRWLGGAIFALGFALAAWALATLRAAGTRVETVQPTTAIVTGGPYRFTRNPIYVGMFLGLIGLAVGFDSLWIVVALVPFYLVIRYGVVAREEAYLERKFGNVYRDYKSRVGRWFG
jgi:protein-S-isoprenylcysteine O-methyltransferase Ste14